MSILSRLTRTGRTSDGLVVALRPFDPAAPYLDAWRALGRRALVDNLFFEPDFVIAAAPAFDHGIGLLMIGDRPPEQPGLRLLALLPCRVAHRWGLPIPVLMGVTHAFSIFGAPLVDRSDPRRALAGLLFEGPRLLRLPRRVMLPYLPLDGPLAASIAAIVAGRGGRRADFWAHERGALELASLTASERANYLATSLSGRKARQLDRLYRRLAADGAITHETIRDPDRLGPALDDFIALEATGWKGRAGTAVENSPDEVAFLHRLVRAYGARNEVRIDRLRRDRRSVAISIAFETGSTLWYLKIAHDEAEARNSPGAQLALRVTRTVIEDDRLAMADSCAPPDFPMIATFWGDRRRLAHALVDTGGDRLFRLAVTLETARARLADWRARRKRRG